MPKITTILLVSFPQSLLLQKALKKEIIFWLISVIEMSYNRKDFDAA